ncbi:hypothetical protein K0B96_14670 [Horticoccus luteus]|uniref:Neutral/alkaline ceramidase-like enzyme n=1 Tax=Horticoccus luteus TaxID=2862869 RepID=A0A8F9TT15_9BACT|nr:hypothetical protein [Horticoccus luteus]QYM78526.1 hypothetical protein K0B96_14670 [Horticoccus luteus]
MTLTRSTPGSFAGAVTIDITPREPVFLFGYPHVPRMSTGVHDPLECAALFLQADGRAALFLATDLIFVPRPLVEDVRRRISAATGVEEGAILISATHTHSGPLTADQVGNAADPVVPKADQAYLSWLGDRLVDAACRAVSIAVPAEVGRARAQAEGVGSNRHDPAGPTDPDVPILIARDAQTKEVLACMLVYGMHPTVLHEDSTLFSADFPFFTRRFLQEDVFGKRCVVLFHNGASGNQSPRHMTKANTFAEAQRLGENLGRSVAAAVQGVEFAPLASVRYARAHVDLIARTFPSVAAARENVERVRARYRRLQQEGASRQSVRTAECDVFGAEETAELALAAENGQLAGAIAACTPAEIQAVRLDGWTYVAWPGEFFVEFGLAVKARSADTFLVTIANGELQGYIVTDEAVAKGYYESLNAVFAASNGARFVEATAALVARLS